MRLAMLAILTAVLYFASGAGESFAKDRDSRSGNEVSKAARAARTEDLKGKDRAEKVYDAMIEKRRNIKDREVAGKKDRQ